MLKKQKQTAAYSPAAQNIKGSCFSKEGSKRVPVEGLIPPRVCTSNAEVKTKKKVVWPRYMKTRSTYMFIRGLHHLECSSHRARQQL